MSPALSDRIAILDTLHLFSGSHESFAEGACVMEAVAYVAGEPWSDHPACACPVISAFLRSWNDSLCTDEDRDRLLKPLVLQLIDTKSTPAAEERRAYLALDWMVRVFTPKWLDLVPALAPHSKALRDLEEITDLAGASAVGTSVRAAGDAAWDAAGAAPWDAARAAARAAAGEFLKPTTEWLQASALDLVARMIACSAPTSAAEPT